MNFFCHSASIWTSLGCFRDSGSDRAIPPIEGTGNPFLDGANYEQRSDALSKCYKAASSLGFQCFGVQGGGWCVGSVTACQTFDKYGPATNCAEDGEGGFSSNNVYRILGNDL